MVVIPPNLERDLGSQDRVVPYFNDVFVHMDGTCLPLQDMRDAGADGTTVVIKPFHAAVFWIKLKWNDELGFVCV